MENIASYGYWVRRRRKALDLTQVTLAHKVGCAVVTIRKIERDERRPSRQMANLLADHLEIPAADRETFLRMSRGEFVTEIASPIESIPSPIFFKQPDDLKELDQPRFVAREVELAQLNAFLDLAQSGQGRVVFVIGGPGRGKTALVDVFTRQAIEKQAELAAANGYCNAYSGVGDPYLPFREILGQLTGDVETRWAAGAISPTHAQRLWDLMPFSVQTLVSTGPDLIDTFISGPSLLTRSTAAAPEGASWFTQLHTLVATRSADQGSMKLKQSDLFEQYVKVMVSLSRQRPLLLVLDDLQWADSGSINLLFHLGRRLQGSHILIVGIYRPVEVALGRAGEQHPLEPLVKEFQRHFGQIQIDLSQAEGRQFVSSLVDAEPNRLGKLFQEALYQHTKGHALFTVEMLRGLQERGDLVQDEAKQWVEGSDLNWETLPAQVEAVIGDRIARLPTILRNVLEVASVAGEEFTAEVVARIQTVDERELVRQLSGDLDKEHRLVVGQASQRLGDRRLSQYRFRHILFQRYLYNTLDEVERAYLHEAVANELERLYGEQSADIAGEIARHFEAAGLLDKAVSYYQQAGDRAVRLSANEEALAHFSKGLALLEIMPQTPDHQQQEIAIQLALFAPLAGAKGYGAPELGKAYTRAQELSMQVGEPDQLFRALYGLWGHNLVLGDMKIARDLAAQCLTLAEKTQERALLMEGRRMTDETAFYRGKLLVARKYLEQTLLLYDPQLHHAHSTTYGQDPGVASFSHGSWIYWHLGYPDQALKMVQKAVTLGKDVSHPFSLGFALCYGAVAHQLCQDVQRVDELVEAAITLSKEHGFVLWLAIATVLRGWVLAKRGKAEEGIVQMRQGLADYKAISVNLSRPYLLALQAEVSGDMGRSSEGLIILEEAMTLVEKGDLRHYEAELFRLQGELLLMQGESPEEVEVIFQQAIKIARQQEAKSLELRSVMSWSRLLHQQGKAHESRQMLAEISAWFTEGFNTGDLKEARGLLGKLT